MAGIIAIIVMAIVAISLAPAMNRADPPRRPAVSRPAPRPTVPRPAPPMA